MVPAAGVEPARSKEQQILSLQRLPIPPRGHVYGLACAFLAPPSKKLEPERGLRAIHSCQATENVYEFIKRIFPQVQRLLSDKSAFICRVDRVIEQQHFYAIILYEGSVKKLATASLALLATAFVASSAHAEKRWPNWYVGLHGGWAMDDSYDATTAGTTTSVDTDGGYILGASLGYVPPTEVPFFDMTRYELEYSFRRNDVEAPGSGEFDSHTAMLNMLVDFENQTAWTPYVGGGVGLTQLDVDGEDDSTFGWQLMAGLDYSPKTMPMTVWGVRYRYLGASDADITTGGVNTEYEYDSHSVEASARFRF